MGNLCSEPSANQQNNLELNKPRVDKLNRGGEVEQKVEAVEEPVK